MLFSRAANFFLIAPKSTAFCFSRTAKTFGINFVRPHSEAQRKFWNLPSKTTQTDCILFCRA
jgi:hypothetical protein